MRVADCALPDLDASVGLDLTAPDAAVQLNLWLQVLRVDILGAEATAPAPPIAFSQWAGRGSGRDAGSPGETCVAC